MKKKKLTLTKKINMFTDSGFRNMHMNFEIETPNKMKLCSGNHAICGWTHEWTQENPCENVITKMEAIFLQAAICEDISMG